MKYFKLMLFVVLLIMLSLTVASAQDDDAGESWLPAPTGPYQVGRTSRHWVDETREEPFTDDEDDYREVMVRIWYPADVEEDATPGTYWAPDMYPAIPSFTTEGLAIYFATMSISFEELVHLPVHAFDDAPVSSEQPSYPVLVFSPGGGGPPEGFTVQMEELTSHGYIVVGINHPYNSGATVFPDGRIVAVDISDFLASWRPHIPVAAEDMIFVLDQLEIVNADDPEGMFTGRLDLDRVGAFGMSLGGHAAPLAGTQDGRFQAIIDEDGGGSASGLEQPFMFMGTGPRTPSSRGPSYTFWVPGFLHGDYSDGTAYPDISRTYYGPIDGRRTVEIIRAYVLAFFDKYIKGEEVLLLDGPSDDYPEVGISFRNVDINWAGGDWSEMDFSDADLPEEDFSNANLQRANFSDANLQGANLSEANLQEAWLRDANLEGADLSVADLRGASLRGADLEGANLSVADLRGANLYRTNLQGAELTDAVFDDTTTLPDDSNWTPDTDMTRFTDPEHPDFWDPCVEIEYPPSYCR